MILLENTHIIKSIQNSSSCKMIGYIKCFKSFYFLNWIKFFEVLIKTN